MNISEPKDFKHNIHYELDPSTGDAVLSPIKTLPKENLKFNISGPTNFKHHVHGRIDPGTGRVVCQNKINHSLLDTTFDDSLECNNCQELKAQLKRILGKNRQMQEENHFMYATVARLSVYADQVQEHGFCENRFSFLGHTNDNLKDFEENIASIFECMMSTTNEKYEAYQHIQELSNEINVLQSKLADYERENSELRTYQLKMKADRMELNSRVEDLKLLKPHIIELQHENDQLRKKIRNLKVLFAEWNGTTSRISGALYHETSVLEIKKENECLKEEIKQLDINRNRLDEEVSFTMNELLRSRENPQNVHSTPNKQLGKSMKEMEDRKDTEEIEDNQSSTRNQVYNITAKTINMIEKSKIKYGHGGQVGEVTDSEEETLI